MAKRHVKEQLKILSEKYSIAQKLYEDISEEFAESMIDPDTLEEFQRIKNTLDSALSTVSEALSSALLKREEFLKLIEKLKANRDVWRKALNEFEAVDDPEKKASIAFNVASYRDFVINADNAVMFIEEANRFASLPNRKNRRNSFKQKVYLFYKIDKSLDDLKRFYEEL